MGVSLEVWRARIGAFVGVMRSISSCQRRLWPIRPRTRTYKRPPDEPRTHHVTMEILGCIILLILACICSHQDPLRSVREQGFDRITINALVMFLGTTYRRKMSWQDAQTLAVRMALFLLLMLCGDVECNPGPDDFGEPMGVSLDVWRARIGAFLGVMRSISSCQRRLWPSRPRTRTYKRPPDEPRTHHVTMEILGCIILLILACICSHRDPLKSVRKQGFDRITINALVMFLGATYRRKRSWQDAQSLAVRMVLFLLLMLCGDVECNPGPDDFEKTAARRKKVHKIHLIDKDEKFGTSASSLKTIWQEICNRWEDVDPQCYVLTEEDGTQVSDEDYFQELNSKTLLQLRRKNEASSSTTATHSFPGTVSRRLTDEIIHELATKRIPNRIRKLGAAMGLTHATICTYEAEDATEPRAERKGTSNMIHDWLQGTGEDDQVEAFCKVLQNAGLVALADYLSAGIAESSLLQELTKHLRNYFPNTLCFMRTVPWDKTSAVTIDEAYLHLCLFHRKKTSRRKYHLPTKQTSTRGKSADRFRDEMGMIFGEKYSTEDDESMETETMLYLKEEHKDIFRIKQNNARPRRILVSGHPGVGKTALFKKIAYDWVNPSEPLTNPIKEVKLLIYISLINVSKKANLGTEVIRQLLPKDVSMDCNGIEECFRQHGEDVVILLDCFDESPLSLISSEDGDKEYGSLYAALINEKFCSNCIMISTRNSKTHIFRGELFNPYVEIVVVGFAHSSIKSSIGVYCLPEDVQKVIIKVNTDLCALRHLLRIPLFCVIICKMVCNGFDIKPPFTLTKLIQQFCDFLLSIHVEKCKAKMGTHKQSEKHELRLNESLQLLGEISINKRKCIIKKKATPQENELLQFSSELGFILLDEESKHTSLQFKFFHSLIRDFCEAKYLISIEESKNLSADQSDVVFSYSPSHRSPNVTSFLCGLCPTMGKKILRALKTEKRELLEFIQYYIDHPLVEIPLREKESDGTRDHSWRFQASTAYFEGQMAGNDDVDFEVFHIDKVLVVNLDAINSLTSTIYTLQEIRQSQTGFHFDIFFLEGRTMTELDREMLLQEDLHEALLVKPLTNILNKCPFLTYVQLANLTFSHSAAIENTSQMCSFDRIEDIHMYNCIGLEVVKFLLHFIAHHEPRLKEIVLRNISQLEDIESKTALEISDVFKTLADVGSNSKCIYLNNIRVADLLWQSPGMHEPQSHALSLESLKTLEIANCESTIEISSVLYLLSQTCPQLNNVTFSDCMISMKSIGREGTLIDTSKGLCFLLVDNCNCESEISLLRLLSILSTYFPSTREVVVSQTEINTEAISEEFCKTAKLEKLARLTISRCSNPIDMTKLLHNMNSNMCIALERLKLILCKPVFSCVNHTPRNTKHVIQNISICNCSSQSRSLDNISYWCKSVCITSTRNNTVITFEFEGERKTTTASLQSYFPVNNSNIAQLLDYSSDLKVIYFNYPLDVTSCRSATSQTPDVLSFPSVEEVGLIEPVQECLLDLADAVLVLHRWFPSLQRLWVMDNAVSFTHTRLQSQNAELTVKRITFEKCKPANFVDVLHFISLQCPFTEVLSIIDSDFNFEFDSYFPCEHVEIIDVLRQVQFSELSEIVNFIGIIRSLSAYTAGNIDLNFRNCSFSSLDSLDLSNTCIARMAISFDNCSISPKFIDEVLGCCDLIYVPCGNIQLRMKIYEGTRRGVFRPLDMDGREQLDIHAVRTMERLLKNPVTFYFRYLSFCLPTHELNDISFNSARKFLLAGCTKVFETDDVMSLMKCCPNLQHVSIFQSNDIFENINFATHVGIREVIVKECNQVTLYNFLRFSSTCFPNLEEVSFVNCKSILRQHQVPPGEPRLKFQHLLLVKITNSTADVDMADVIKVFKSIFTVMPTRVNIFGSRLTFSSSPHVDTIGDGKFDEVGIQCCSFPPTLIPYIMPYCRVVVVEVHSTLNVAIGDRCQFAQIQTEIPINMDDIPDLQNWCPNLNELTFQSTLKDSSSFPSGFSQLRIIGFDGCQEPIDLVHVMSLVPDKCPQLSELMIGTSHVCFGHIDLQQTQNHIQSNVQLSITLRQCGIVNMLDVMSFVSVCRSRLHTFGLQKCKVVYDFSCCQTSNILQSSVQNIVFCDCDIPENFCQLLTVGLPCVFWRRIDGLLVLEKRPTDPSPPCRIL